MAWLQLCVVLLVLVVAGPAATEIYRWTDAQGRDHFTQDLNQVPPRYRRQAEERAATPSASTNFQTFRREDSAASSSPPSPASLSDSGSAESYQIAVQRAGTSMLVMARLNNAVSAPFLIDTGASDVLISAAVARQLGLETGAEARTKRYSTANGIVEHPVVMLRSVSLGGATVENVPASVSDSMEVGLLGLSFFNHFNYNIDAASGIVTLKPNRLATTGQIRGGRSQAQWQAEYANLKSRIRAVEWEHEHTSTNKARERRRLEDLGSELERQLDLLDDEADRARVPMAWRD